MGNGWGNAYRSCAFTGAHKLPDQISEQGADRHDDSVKRGEIHEYESKSKDQRIAGDTGNLPLRWRAMCYLRGHLPAEQISGIGALALIFVGAGAGTTKAKQ